MRLRRALVILGALAMVGAVAGGLRWVWRAEIEGCLSPEKATWEVAAVCETACNRGDARSCLRLGGLHERGEAGAKEDVKEAARLYRFACENGEARGCEALAALEKGAATGR